jgi:hypothetical protein
MDERYERKCARCGEVKPITDFPLELAVVNPALAEYCVPCLTYLMKLINDPNNWKKAGGEKDAN